jgi:Fe2+ transport system protein FeoA
LALDVLSRHRLAERLLTEVLRIDWSRVHDPTCGLEHAFATEVVRPQENVLVHPSTFPHGNPIPPESGEVFEESPASLIRLESNERGTIIKVTEEKREILQYLTTLGLALGATVEMKEKDPLQRIHNRGGDGIKSHPRPRNRINNLRQEISFQEVTSILDDEIRITCSMFTVAEGLWSYLQKK